jgi:anti-sigma-K factor RskA
MSIREGSVVDPALSKDDFNRFVDRHDHQHAELDTRIARDLVPLPMYVADQRSNERRFAELERDLADVVNRHDRDIVDLKAEKADNSKLPPIVDRVTILEARPANMRNYLIALAGLALTLLGIVVSAYFAARGAS